MRSCKNITNRGGDKLILKSKTFSKYKKILFNHPNYFLFFATPLTNTRIQSYRNYKNKNKTKFVKVPQVGIEPTPEGLTFYRRSHLTNR